MLKRGIHGAIAAVLLAAFVSGCEEAGLTEHEHEVVELDASALTRVHIGMGAGELEVKGGAANLLEADFSYNDPEWKPTVSHTSKGTESDLEITQGPRKSGFGKTENRWQLALND